MSEETVHLPGLDHLLGLAEAVALREHGGQVTLGLEEGSWQAFWDPDDELTIGSLGAAATAAAIRAAIAWGATLAPLILAGAAVAVIVGAFQDLWVSVNGGNGMLRRLSNELIGVGATSRLIADLQTAWRALVADINAAWEGVEGFGEAVADTYRLLTTGSAENPEERHDRETRERQAEIWGRARQLAAGSADVEQTGGVRQGVDRRPRATPTIAETPLLDERRERRRAPRPTMPVGALGLQPAFVTAGSNRTINVTSPVNVNMTINGATDEHRVGRLVEARITETMRRERQALINQLAGGEDEEE